MVLTYQFLYQIMIFNFDDFLKPFALSSMLLNPDGVSIMYPEIWTLSKPWKSAIILSIQTNIYPRVQSHIFLETPDILPETMFLSDDSPDWEYIDIPD